MLKKMLALLILSCLTILLLTGCGGSAATGPNPVHMSATQFTQSSITIKKGESITLINDNAFVSHTIANGTWVNSTAQTGQESGAPAINNVQIGGGSSTTIGPFPTAGTFHLYCTVHVGMNLTVVVA